MPPVYRKVYEKSRNLGKMCVLSLRNGIPRKVLFFGYAIGDDLLCTTILHEWRKRGESNLWMMTNYAPIFENNPDVDVVMPTDEWLFKRLPLAKIHTVYPLYAPWRPHDDHDVVPPGHLLETMCRIAGITGEIALKPHLYLTEAEQEQGRIAPKQIVIQSTGLNAKFPMKNKEWYPERFQQVVTALRSEYQFVQLGTANDPLLEGATDLRGKTTLREAAAILHQSQAFVGQVGFLMHLARAVDCRSVIVYGGREAPQQSGYSCNHNIFTPMPCAPCWNWNGCDFQRECMSRIQAHDVIAGIETVLKQRDEPLAVDTAHLSLDTP